MEITYCVIHHSGGTEKNLKASSKNLTLNELNNAHSLRWPEKKSMLGYWVGYNAVIFPDGQMIQTRLIGEETCAQKGHNFDSISICLIGNFTKGVDSPTALQTIHLKNIMLAILNNRPEDMGLFRVTGTQINVKLNNIVPHRVLWPTTECFGNSLKDTWAQDLLGFPKSPMVDKAAIYSRLVGLLSKLKALLNNQKLGSMTNSKKWFESRTLWLAVTQGILGVLMVLTTQYPGIGGFLVAKAIVDGILRVLTDSPISK